MERSGASAFCCGAGGGAKAAYPDFAESSGKERLAEAEATGASILVTSCVNCQSHLQQVAEKYGINMRVADLYQLLSETASAGQGGEL
jgi:Fe-S oxidoreductase